MTHLLKVHNLLATALCALCVGGTALTSHAATISELEGNGTSANNTLASAQLIPAGTFTLPAPATVFNSAVWPTATIQGLNGGNDVDFFRFSSPGGTVYLDMDNSSATFDPIVALFNSQGTLLAYGDDSPIDPGSANSIDSSVGVFRLPTPGDYYIAVSENANFPTTALTGTETALRRPDGLFGGYSVSGVPAGVSTYDFNGPQVAGLPYTLQLSIDPVPEPASVALLALGGAGLVAAGIRRRLTKR